MCKKCFLTLIGILLLAKVVYVIVVWLSAGAFILTLNGWMFPMWLMDVGVIVDILLALWALKIAMHIGHHECKDKGWDMKKKRK